jgi:hypothetical protein
MTPEEMYLRYAQLVALAAEAARPKPILLPVKAAEPLREYPAAARAWPRVTLH